MDACYIGLGEAPAMEAKDELRSRIRELRQRTDRGTLLEAGARVADRVLQHPAVRESVGILCYLSARREVPTGLLVDGLQKAGLTVAVPRMVGDRDMEARLLEGRPVPGAMGIRTSDGPLVDTIDVCICPGLAFDRRGGRLGYGGGTYDRWLAAHPVTTIGLCLEEALVDEVPIEAHDRRMDFLVTPERVIRTAPLRVVAALWIRGDRVLAAQRGPGRLQGKWEFPGGKVEPGETDAEALVREIEEELGCTVVAHPEPVAEVLHDYRHMTVHLVALHTQDDRSRDPRLIEHQAVRWLSSEELDHVDWVSADVDLLPVTRQILAAT